MQAQLVDLELSLLVDVSGSITASEFDLQRQGYADAFASSSLQDTILSTANGRLGAIAVNLVFWAGVGQQTEVVGWTLLDSAAAIDDFAAAIAVAPRTYLSRGRTAIGDALAFATPLFESNTFTSSRQVIDISGDGATNAGSDTADARDATLAAGVESINGIVILGEDGLQDFYTNNVVGGSGHFLRTASGFDVFGEAIADKLAFEIGGTVPEPATYGAIGAAVLCGLALWRRRSTSVPA
ncbi:MAG: DUF1194 domain-containing protein [Opitutaceae bacterium]